MFGNVNIETATATFAIVIEYIATAVEYDMEITVDSLVECVMLSNTRQSRAMSASVLCTAAAATTGDATCAGTS
jgi:hypothetical protein